MLRLVGIPISDQDARDLIATLIRDGGVDATEAAIQIGRAMAESRDAVALTPTQRDAILSVLADPPAGLVDLRGTLAQDHVERDL